MIRSLRIARRASADVDVLFAFVKKRSGPATAERWRNQLFNRLTSLEEHAGVWPSVEDQELADLGFRECLFRYYRHVYRIFYTIEGGMVHVRRIRSAAQDQLAVEEF